MFASAFRAAVDLLEADAEPRCAVASDDELVKGLQAAAELGRVVDRQIVACVADLGRRGVLDARGYRNIPGALCDLTGMDRADARLLVGAAEHVVDRVALDGSVLPARLPATAAQFAAGELGLRHVEVIAQLRESETARRLDPETWAGAEIQLAEQARCCTPAQLTSWGRELIEMLDDDGPRPDDRPPPPVNELQILRRRDGGGALKGRFDDAALFATVVTALDAVAAPRDGEDERPVGQRQADALAEVCAQVLDQGTLPAAGGSRPQVVVHIRLEDLQRQARAAVLDLGGVCAPGELRRLACDAAVIPIVLGGQSQPLDVGRSTRTVPDGLRRAVTARDRGCAHPGCDRPPSWTEIHHVVPWSRGGPTALDNLVQLCLAIIG